MPVVAIKIMLPRAGRVDQRSRHLVRRARLRYFCLLSHRSPR
jgi:hypothetical protein